MDRTNAERQRRYIARLKAAAAGVDDGTCSNSHHSAKAAAAAVNNGTCSTASSPHSAYALMQMAQNEVTDEAGAKLRRLGSELADATDEIQTLRFNCAQANRELAEAQSIIDHLHSELAEKKAALEAANAKIAEPEAE
jgi:chromosome segregation ATPase